MNRLFDEVQCREIINRINKLSGDSNASWGKMNVSQMLAHTEVPLLLALGEIKIRKTLIGLLLGRYAKKKLLKNEIFKKNLPTVKEFAVKDKKDFELEKINLIKTVEKYTKADSVMLSKNKHPFFGYLKPAEWDTLMFKHLDHHLRQFGV